MGSWGPKLYQDDIAEDVRSYYKDQLKRGRTNEEATNKLIQSNQDIIEDEDGASVFWFSLADTQWNLGRLLPFVKEKALDYLNSKSDLNKWKNEAISQKEYKDREKILQELEKKLKSPMPPEKKISQYKLYKCEWNIGDAFAYELKSNYSKESGENNRYLIIRKVDEYIWHPGHVIPIVYVQITNDEKIPRSKEEFSKLEYIQMSSTEGMPEYLVKMISTSKRVIPNKQLIFIGNYVDIATPKEEHIPKNKISIIACNWSKFEKTMIDKYLKLNLGES